MEFTAAEIIVEVLIEGSLGISLKLWCDHGRVHYADFVNDFLFWVPGVNAQDHDGLTRQILALRDEAVEGLIAAPSAAQ